jgi:hypothetical protein
VKKKGKAVPLQAWTGPQGSLGFQEVEAPRFLDSRHMKVVRLSALRTGRVYAPGNIPGTHFCYRLSRPQGHSATGRFMPMKNALTPSGIEPATCRFVAKCLNHLRHRVPQSVTKFTKFKFNKKYDFFSIFSGNSFHISRNTSVPRNIVWETLG